MAVSAFDADDPAYGSSARVVYSVLEGEKHFTVDSKTGKSGVMQVTLVRGSVYKTFTQAEYCL